VTRSAANQLLAALTKHPETLAPRGEDHSRARSQLLAQHRARRAARCAASPPLIAALLQHPARPRRSRRSSAHRQYCAAVRAAAPSVTGTAPRLNSSCLCGRRHLWALAEPPEAAVARDVAQLDRRAVPCGARSASRAALRGPGGAGETARCDAERRTRRELRRTCAQLPRLRTLAPGRASGSAPLPRVPSHRALPVPAHGGSEGGGTRECGGRERDARACEAPDVAAEYLGPHLALLAAPPPHHLPARSGLRPERGARHPPAVARRVARRAGGGVRRSAGGGGPRGSGRRPRRRRRRRRGRRAARGARRGGDRRFPAAPSSARGPAGSSGPTRTRAPAHPRAAAGCANPRTRSPRRPLPEQSASATRGPGRLTRPRSTRGADGAASRCSRAWSRAWSTAGVIRQLHGAPLLKFGPEFLRQLHGRGRGLRKRGPALGSSRGSAAPELPELVPLAARGRRPRDGAPVACHGDAVRLPAR
jgi:hypothetical protein